MAMSYYQFYEKGVDIQKRCSISVKMIRPDHKQMAKWTPEQKREAKDFLKRAIKSFEGFCEEINSL